MFKVEFEGGFSGAVEKLWKIRISCARLMRSGRSSETANFSFTEWERRFL